MIYWVRHGQSTWNLIDRMQGHELSPPLTELGRAQSAAAADALVDRGVVRVLSSPAVRALETAAIIGERLGLEVVTEPLLLEKGLDEEVVHVIERVKRVIDAQHPSHTVAVSHGDTIALAVATLTSTPPQLPDNASIIGVEPLTRRRHDGLG
ncbi:MAG: histidine phosphatase family protein [Aeromicrobium sp.]